MISKAPQRVHYASTSRIICRAETLAMVPLLATVDNPSDRADKNTVFHKFAILLC